ncbi:MAG: LytR family transcriptional regulator [Candidatus Saccharibacteria bacterium]|nr:LytR family transcriptional regulator [Candidatus Saccharibacteria bacterium]
MDSTRFKRRETNNKRQIVDDFRRNPPRSVSRGVQAAPTMGAQPRAPITAPVTPAIVPMQPAPVHIPLVPGFVEHSPQPLAPAPGAAGRSKKLLRIDMGLPGDASPEKSSRLKIYRSRWIAFRRWAFRSVAVILIMVIGLGGVLFSQGYFQAKKVFGGGKASAAALRENVDPTLLKGEGDGRINVLLLGRGGGDHEAPDLTDTLMLASIDPVNHKATLLSLPRDLWVQVNGGTMKINAAWETGKYKALGHISDDMSNKQAVQAGFSQIDQTVEEVVGLPIHYNMLVDFSAFKQAVDTVGGVTVNVPSDLVDPTMAWENNWNPVLAKAGVQQMDGKEALIYARSRETSSDFARAERQRALLLALKEKVKTAGTLSNPVKISGLFSAFGDNAQSDLSLSDASRMYSIIKDIDNSNITSISLAQEGNSYVTTANINGQSVVQPKAGQFEYSAIQTYVRSQIKDPYLLNENASVLVLNGTTVAGEATTAANTLKSYGYNVIGTGNAPTNDYSETKVISLNPTKKYTKNYLEQRYGVKAQTTLPDTSIQPGVADFVIIIGSDEATTN